jgi:hypothetical protein
VVRDGEEEEEIPIIVLWIMNFVSKSTCIVVMTITSYFLLEFENVSSILKLWYSFFNYNSSVDESTT